MSRNEELAAVFQEIATVMQYQGENRFKIKAYVDFIDTLADLDRPVEDMTEVELEALPGVGRIIREKTRLYFDNGTFNLLDRVRQVDPGIRGLLTAGLMPSAVRALEQKASITSTEALLTAHKADTLSLTGIPTRQRNAIKAFVAARAES
ncbi:MAG: DNA polymerase (family 10) [Myxococcota bacterium]|jgi:DNA polymerase (family 10)